VVRSGYHIDGTRSAEETRLNTKIGRERNGRAEFRSATGKRGVCDATTNREAIDKGFEIVPVKFCSSAEYEENRSLIVNVSVAF